MAIVTRSMQLAKETCKKIKCTETVGMEISFNKTKMKVQSCKYKFQQYITTIDVIEIREEF